MKINRVLLWLILALATTAFAQDPKKVSKDDALASATNKVTPQYPQIARQLKIEGTVELEAVIGETGEVEKVNIVAGNPVLTRPASDALKKWRFKPFASDGKPARVMAPFSFTFKI